MFDFVDFLHSELSELHDQVKAGQEVEQNEILIERLTDAEALFYDFIKVNKNAILAECTEEEPEAETAYYLFATWLYLEQKARGNITADDDDIAISFDALQPVTEEEERIDNAFLVVGLFEQYIEDNNLLDDDEEED